MNRLFTQTPAGRRFLARSASKLLLLSAIGLVTACPGDDFPDDDPRFDFTFLPDAGSPDLAPPPDSLPNDPNGPAITLTTPEQDALIVTDSVKVTAEIQDDDGIDDLSVQLFVQGREASPLTMSSVSTNPTTGAITFEANLDLTADIGAIRFWVIAADLLGNRNSAVREISRDAGPVISFVSPNLNDRRRASVSIQIKVGHLRPIARFEATLGGTEVDLTGRASGEDETTYSGTISFSDFSPPLSGDPLILAEVENDQGAVSRAQRQFIIDDEGPDVSINGLSAGALIGGVTELNVSVSDPAGISEASVSCLFGQFDDDRAREVVLTQVGTSNTWAGQFDTRQLGTDFALPLLSCRAADALGNENDTGFEVRLDNVQPIMELDPPGFYDPVTGAGFFHGRPTDAGEFELSHPFDPVGYDAANDLFIVPQLQDVRARIEDRGKSIDGSDFAIVSLNNNDSMKMYLLNDTSRPLVIDTDEDGYCDAINPDVIPLGTVVLPSQAAALDISPITPGGNSNFTPYPASAQVSASTTLMLDFVDVPQFVTFGNETRPTIEGDQGEPPLNRCDDVRFTRVTYHTNAKSNPSIYTIPPVGPNGEGELGCGGLQFDFANGFDEGWACIAVSGEDNLGNKGVSPPIRVWVDFAPSGPAPGVAAPNCTGTLNKETGEVTDTPCTFCEESATGLNGFCTGAGAGLPVFPQLYPRTRPEIRRE